MLCDRTVRPRSAITLLIAGGMLAAAGSAAAPSAAGQATQKQSAAGFDSRLWYSLYQADPQTLEAAAGTTDAASGHPAVSQLPHRLRISAVTPISSAPLAEVLLKQETGQHLTEPPWTAERNRENLHAAASGTQFRGTSDGGGPSLITILVGLAAAIVVCGAVCSGNG